MAGKGYLVGGLFCKFGEILFMENLVGKRFERWIVIKHVGVDKHRRQMWFCRCDCGTEKQLAGIALRGGKTKSCGCYLKNHPKKGKPVVDLVGKKFGRLLVSRESGRDKSGQVKWLCVCDCGKEKEVLGINIKRGLTTSCGCYSIESHKKHEMTASREYQSWQHMKDRCLNPDNDGYHRYGGRGITVCERWLGADGFVNFFADMGERPKGKTLDRYPDKNGNYGPDNCRWATPREQLDNRNNTVWYECNGIRMVQSDWQKRWGLNWGLINNRLEKGMSFCEIFDYFENKKPG